MSDLGEACDGQTNNCDAASRTPDTCACLDERVVRKETMCSPSTSCSSSSHLSETVDPVQDMYSVLEGSALIPFAEVSTKLDFLTAYKSNLF